MRQALGKKREEFNVQIRNNHKTNILKEKRMHIMEELDLSVKREQTQNLAVQQILSIRREGLPAQAIDVALKTIQQLGRDYLNHQVIVSFLIDTLKELIKNKLQDTHRQTFKMARQSLNVFLSSADAVVLPYLKELQGACTHPLMREVFYNLSIIQAWPSEDLKRSYLTTLLNIIQTQGMMIQNGLAEVESFLINRGQPVEETAIFTIIDLINREMVEPEAITDENANKILDFMELLIISDGAANYIIENADSLLSLTIYRLKFCNSNCIDNISKQIKMNALRVLTCMFSFRVPTEKMFSRYDMLPYIIKKRLGDTLDPQTIQELAMALGQLVKYSQSTKIILEKNILDQMVGIAFMSTKKLNRNTQNEFKKMLLNLAIYADQKHMYLLIRNNLSAVIMDILKQESDLQLTLLALECVKQLLKTDRPHRYDQQQHDEYVKRGQIMRELNGRYNIHPVLERMCSNPNTAVSDIANDILNCFFTESDLSRF